MPWVIIFTVCALAGIQVYDLAQKRVVSVSDDPEVLAATTDKSLEERVASLENRVYVLERNVGLIRPASTGKIKEQFVQLSGGTINSADWVEMPGTNFTLDTSLYGKSVEVSWQGWIENGNGSVRIFDDTNQRAVDSSEISVDSGVRSSFYSKPISIWRGQNQYHIEGKNPFGELNLTSPRLRIVTR